MFRFLQSAQNLPGGVPRKTRLIHDHFIAGSSDVAIIPAESNGRRREFNKDDQVHIEIESQRRQELVQSLLERVRADAREEGVFQGFVPEGEVDPVAV